LRKQRILLVQTLSQFQFAIETAMAIVDPPTQTPGAVEEDDYDV
jgi:protein tyrosine phosphatase